MTTPLLRLQGIHKTFGATEVLQGIDFTIAPGEVVALLGDNGAGKSTLVKIISGVETPTSGKIEWNGAPAAWSGAQLSSDLREHAPRLAREAGIETVPQDLALIETLSIARNFFLGRELIRRRFGIPSLDLKQIEAIAAGALYEIGVRRKLDPRDTVRSLSGGERQAIAIARAKYFGAKLLMLDEPTSALSLRQTEQVLSFISEAASSGIAVIFITHTLAHIEGIIDRMTILFHGKKAGDFTPSELVGVDRSNVILFGHRKSATVSR